MKTESEPFNIQVSTEVETVKLYPFNWPLREKVKAIYGIISGDTLQLEKEK